ncbi:MAG: 30S ribosomal protein S17 [Candidatus Babeliales bacterium]
MLQGKVVSDNMDKTIVVEFKRTYKHALTGKVMKSIKKYKVHDESEQAKVGDIVEFYEGRPLSKTKYMYLAQIINQ